MTDHDPARRTAVIPIGDRLIARALARGVPMARAGIVACQLASARSALKQLAKRTRNGCCVRSCNVIRLESEIGERIDVVPDTTFEPCELIDLAERSGLIISPADCLTFAGRELDRVYLVAVEPIALSLELLRDRRLARPVDALLQADLARLELRGLTWFLVPGSGGTLRLKLPSTYYAQARRSPQRPRRGRQPWRARPFSR